MNSSQIIGTFRYFWASDATLQSYLEATSRDEALKQILAKDASYMSLKDGYKYPGLAVRLIDDYDDARIPSNNEFLEVMLINDVKKSNSLLTIYNIKDRIKEMTIDRINGHAKLDNLNAQGQSLGFDTKIRGVFWVSASPYDEKEQGSERLQRLTCLMRLIVGD